MSTISSVEQSRSGGQGKGGGKGGWSGRGVDDLLKQVEKK